MKSTEQEERISILSQIFQKADCANAAYAQNISRNRYLRLIEYYNRLNCRGKQDKNIEDMDELVDMKGKKYFGAPAKYYFEDIGLCNANESKPKLI